MECIVQKTGTVNCHVCGKEFITNFEWRTRCMCDCPKHKDIVAFCGLPEDICEECKNIGWQSLSGSGGGRGVKNIETNEYRE